MPIIPSITIQDHTVGLSHCKKKTMLNPDTLKHFWHVLCSLCQHCGWGEVRLRLAWGNMWGQSPKFMIGTHQNICWWLNELNNKKRVHFPHNMGGEFWIYGIRHTFWTTWNHTLYTCFFVKPFYNWNKINQNELYSFIFLSTQLCFTIHMKNKMLNYQYQTYSLHILL